MDLEWSKWIKARTNEFDVVE